MLEYNNYNKWSNITEVKKALDTYCRINYDIIGDCIDQNRIKILRRPIYPYTSSVEAPTSSRETKNDEGADRRVTRSMTSSTSTTSRPPTNVTSMVTNNQSDYDYLSSLPPDLPQDIIKTIYIEELKKYYKESAEME